MKNAGKGLPGLYIYVYVSMANGLKSQVFQVSFDQHILAYPLNLLDFLYNFFLGKSTGTKSIETFHFHRELSR